MYPDLGVWVEEHIPALGSGWRSGSWPGSGSVTRWADCGHLADYVYVRHPDFDPQGRR
jgi:asparagine N-glycosylation enzyme membrane subunit Stt3